MLCLTWRDRVAAMWDVTVAMEGGVGQGQRGAGWERCRESDRQ